MYFRLIPVPVLSMQGVPMQPRHPIATREPQVSQLLAPAHQTLEAALPILKSCLLLQTIGQVSKKRPRV